MTDDDDFSTPVHQSLIRPQLLMGGERTLVLLLGMVAGIFIASLHTWWSVIVGIAVWVIGMFALARAGHFDPDLSKTGTRSLRFRKFYPAAATPFAAHRKVEGL